MNIFLPVFFLAVTNKLIEHEFGKKNRYYAEIIACILFFLYAIRHNAYVINCVYLSILLILNYVFFPFLTFLIRKFGSFQDKRQIEAYEKKYILYWLSIIDLGFIICVNIKIYGHYFAVERAVKNSILEKCLSIDNFRYIYNIFIVMLLLYIIRTAWKLKNA